MCTCVRGEGLGQIALCDFSRILEDGRPCSSLCGRPRRESQEASCNFDKASKKDVTLRRRGDDENGNDSNPTKIMLEAGVCRHTPDSSMIFVGLLSLSFSSSPIKNRCFEIVGGNFSQSVGRVRGLTSFRARGQQKNGRAKVFYIIVHKGLWIKLGVLKL